MTYGNNRALHYTFGLICLLAVLGGRAPVEAQSPARKAAIIVENRAGKEFNGKEAVLADLLTSRIASTGFQVMSPADTVNAVQKAGGGAALDKALSEQTSALRLAQNMGADLIFLASLNSYGYEKKKFKDANIETMNETHTLRVAYRILEAGEGGALTGDTVKVSKTVRFTENSRTFSTDLLNELIDQAASALADGFAQRKIQIDSLPKTAGKVRVAIACGMTDNANLPLSVPDLRIGPDGRLIRGTNSLPVELIDVTVEINGLAAGSAPGVFSVPSGINKLRLTREGFTPWERNVSFDDGQKLNVAMQMSPQGWARWKENTRFLQELREQEKMTDARAEAIRGFAQMLRQSGYRVDIKSDTKSDTKVAAKFDIKGKSLYDGGTFNQSNKFIDK